MAAPDDSPPLVRSGCEVGYPPFSIVTEDGLADGFSVELLQAALAKMGREVTFRTGPWSEVRGWLERGEIDCLPLVGRTPEREKLFDFTVPYLSMHGAIVVRQNAEGIHSLADLRGRRVGVMKGDNAEEFLRRKDHGFDIVPTPTFTDALGELAAGRVDAVVMQRLVAIRLLGETELDNLRIVDRPITEFTQDFCFAVTEGDYDMLALLNEGLALAVADGTRRHLHAKWFASLQLPSDRPIVIGGDHNYPPFEFLDKNGRPTGYNVELTRAVAEAAGLDVRIRLGPWPEMIQALASGEIDAMQGMFYSTERDETFNFSQAHNVINCVAVVRRDSGPPPASAADLAGKQIVVQDGDIMHEFCRKNDLTGQLTLVDAQEDALRAVVEGRSHCALVARRTALYWIEQEGWDNLVVGRTPLVSPKYCFAVPNGKRALLAQISDGLATITHSGEYQHIYEKWLGHYEQPPTWRNVLKYVFMVAGPLLLIALLALLWSWGLRRQVARRTAELAALSHRHQAMLEGIPDIVMEVDVRKVYVWANPAGYAFFGDDVIGTEANHYFAGEQDTYRIVQPVFRGEESVVYAESLQWRRDGEARLLAWWSRVLKDENGGVIGAISTARDITESKQQEARIEHLMQVLRAIRDVNQLITHENDRDALLHQACEILISTRGYRSAWIALQTEEGTLRAAAEAGIGEDFEPIRKQLDAGVRPHCCERALDENENVVVMHNTSVNCVTCSLTHQHRDTAALAGALRYEDRSYGVLVVALPKTRADDPEEQSLFRELVGDLAYALHAMETDAHRAEQRALLEAIYRNAPLIMMVVDGKRRIQQVNGFASQFADRSTEEMLGLRGGEALRCVHALDDPQGCGFGDFCENCAIRNSVLDTLENGTTNLQVEVDYFPVPADNRPGTMHLLVSSTPLVFHGERMALVTILDITERKHLESQLRQSQKLESVGRLAGGVAHDFNNLLMGISGYVELCRDEIGQDHPIREWLDQIIADAQRSANLVRQLLAFSRKQTIVPKVLDLSDEVGGMLKMLRRLIGEDIHLSWQPGANLRPVKVDPGQVDQILANLCVNARDAIGGAGKVSIETKNASIDTEYCAKHPYFKPGDYVMLAVSDDGCGMDKKTLESVFEPFFTTKPAGEGTGLGLATVYGIVKQNNGFVNVYSEPGKGTTFRIYLPRVESEEAENKTTGKISAHVGGSETLLVVEDEKAIRTTLNRHLIKLGYNTLTADAPEEALRLVAEREDPIDLLITDVVMPGMSGRELAEKLVSDHPDMKVLYMSGYTANVIAHRGILENNVDFLAKPFTRDDLARKVHEILKGKQPKSKE